jgi:hypothetical protein
MQMETEAWLPLWSYTDAVTESCEADSAGDAHDATEVRAGETRG